MTPEQQALIDRAISRKNLGREEQRRIELEIQTRAEGCTYVE